MNNYTGKVPEQYLQRAFRGPIVKDSVTNIRYPEITYMGNKWDLIFIANLETIS